MYAAPAQTCVRVDQCLLSFYFLELSPPFHVWELGYQTLCQQPYNESAFLLGSIKGKTAFLPAFSTERLGALEFFKFDVDCPRLHSVAAETSRALSLNLSGT